jgi:hypothetical protein
MNPPVKATTGYVCLLITAIVAMLFQSGFAQTPSPAIVLNGAGTTGGDQINHVSLLNQINVQAYGAKGDCTTDDTTAIQNAINAALPGQTVYVPATSSCYKITHLTAPNNINFVGGGWEAAFWGAQFGQGGFAPVLTTTTGINTLPSSTITVANSLAGFDFNGPNVPINVGGQQVFCAGQSGGTQFTGCLGGSGTVAAGSVVFQSFINGTILYSTATSGVAVDFNSNNPSSTNNYSGEGGNLKDVFILGSGTNGTVLNVSAASETAGVAPLPNTSPSIGRLITITTSSSHGVAVGSPSALIIRGVGIAACTPTALSEASNLVTVTCSAAHGLNVGDQIISAGNTPSGYNSPLDSSSRTISFVVNTVSDATHFTYIDAVTGLGAGTGFGTLKNGNYNRAVVAKATSATTFTYFGGPFHDMGAGSGGTVTLAAIGLGIGDSSVIYSGPNTGNNGYQSGLNTDHVGAGNFGIGSSVYEQNANHNTLSIQGCDTDLFIDGNNTGGTTNNVIFQNLKVAGNAHTLIDMLNGSQSDTFDTYDLESTGTYNASNDPTASMLSVSDSDHGTFINGYFESVSSGFAGDAIVLRSYSNTDGNLFLNNHITGNSGAHSDIHLIASASGAYSPSQTAFLNNRLYEKMIVDNTVAYTFMLNNSIQNGSLVDNTFDQRDGTLVEKFGNFTTPVSIAPDGSGFVGDLFLQNEALDLAQWSNGAKTIIEQRATDSGVIGSGSFILGLNKANTQVLFNIDALGGIALAGHTTDAGGTAPTLGACGTSPTVAANAQDNSFEVTSGSGTTSCVVNFASGFTNKPVCGCNDETTAASLKLTPATGSLTVANLTPSDVFMCTCRGH